MTTRIRISAQASAVDTAIAVLRSGKAPRPAERELLVQRLDAALRTLRAVERHEQVVRVALISAGEGAE